GGSQQSAGGSQVAGGGSQQAGSQQQVEEAAPVVVAEPISVPAEAPAAVDRWAHSHPAQPKCTNSVTHTHKYNDAAHVHTYSCSKPQVDVFALQRKLKAKGYYKGPIDGVVGPTTRSALERFMQR
ncbi:MAG: peptidoglycan-binding protein, partial [Thiotrichaceae bacterium]|nr:peptidoglycan-binding protein [Thiotrichaceae bacterium]